MKSDKLKKELRLFDVYAISTGAMFSSGFFILPGIATAYTGPSAIMAYLLAGILVLPAMFSKAELCTAMPRAGGTYYFLDRSLGPLAGTVGGLGTWLALVLKSAFALIGMGAYLVLFVELPMKPVAIALTVAFTLLNIMGSKETTGLQRLFVVTLLSILAFFIVQGLFEVFSIGLVTVRDTQLTPFLTSGTKGLLSTIGLVFVSYAGLTKVASVAEEVQNPDRNIPLGMMLSLLTATVVYVVGVFIMVAVLEPTALREDLTPVATAGAAFLDWLPEPMGLLLMVIAAIAAFASTGNAGILSASRYPLAMARDRLVSERFAQLGRSGTPTLGILASSGAMILFILVFSEQGIAKLASAFNLLVFGLLNLAVIVMRESQIPSYAPGYRSPLYPWMQVVGIFTSVVLIAEIGMLSIVFTLFIIIGCIGWYYYYARFRVRREGAIYHLFERLGRHRYDGLDEELDGILKEKGVSPLASFDKLTARANVLDLEEAVSFREVSRMAAEQLTKRVSVSTQRLANHFLELAKSDVLPISRGTAIPHHRLVEAKRPELVLVRCRSGIALGEENTSEEKESVTAFFFLISPKDQPSLHLRILAALASRMDEPNFMEEWLAAHDEQQLKELLLHHERHLSLYVGWETKASELIGKAVRDLSLPRGTLIALVRRNGSVVVPHGGTTLQSGDQLTFIGEPASIERIYELYGDRQR